MSHQVLVYSGPGVSPLSLSHTLLTLSLLLVPNYTVQPATPELLSTQPWEPACALLVIPGGRDLPFVEELSKRTLVARRIKEYVRTGGRYLGLCAGAYFGSAEVVFDAGGSMEVKGSRELAFYKGICTGPTYRGFAYAAESGSKAVDLVLSSGRSVRHIYYNGGGNFVSPKKEEIVARYSTGEVAVVYIKEGEGCALLCSVHPEYPLDDPPARDAIEKLPETVSEADRRESEQARVSWCRELLHMMGLKTAEKQDESILLHPTHPSPIFVMSRDGVDPFEKVPKMTIERETQEDEEDGEHGEAEQVGTTGKAAEASVTSKGREIRVLRDGNDQLNISPSLPNMPAYLAQSRITKPTLPPLERLSLEPSDNTLEPPAQPDFHSIPKDVFIPASGEYTPAWTPLFNFETYWKALKGRGRLGRMVLYAETVTSTQTMLDRNPILLTHLPTPLAFLASFQLTGRGRGSNIWLSPPGCLQFSLLLTLPSNMASKVVFVQYLMALAVADAVDPTGKLGVRIKWPNDIYAEAEGVAGAAAGSKGKAKLGGILVNTNYVNGQWRLVVGCGINVLNALPTFSLAQLHALHMARQPDSSIAPPTMEETFARIMDAFHDFWETFAENGQGFEPLLNEYYGRWLHRNQEVTLTTTTPHQKVVIEGITKDYGLLRCRVVRESKGLTRLYDRGDFGEKEEYVDLQPDGNSFDLMAGLIKRKT